MRYFWYNWGMEAKPYVVLARKFRPQTFDEVMGQEHVSTTLKNAILMNRIGHAYLFTGPRGVGKTSMARIFAKALNCKTGPTVTPCGKCQPCLEIEGARALDVLEIDGASNRGIDEIRALRENVKFAPAAGKYKIYIIDEVHQITPDGFNALLKTLEEPPAHVKFIFATTSSHKVPATILSRCQRFDFRRIPTALIAETLGEICKKEKIKIDEDALFAVAKAADGSLRDSQSILDQIAASSDKKIGKEDVIRSLGALEEDKLFELTDALASRDAKTALYVLDGVLQEGKDPVLFLERFLEHVRDLLFLQVSEKLADLIDASEVHKKNLLKQKESFSKDDLFYFFNVVTHTLSTMKRFEAKRVPLEIALIKLASRAPMEDLGRLIDALKSAEKKTLSPAGAASATRVATPPLVVPKAEILLHKPKKTEAEEDRELEELPAGDIQLPAAVASAKVSASFEDVWFILLKNLKKEKPSVASYLAEGEPAGIRDRVARILFPEHLSFYRESLETADNKKVIEMVLSPLVGEDIRVEFVIVKELPGKIKSQDPTTQSPAKPVDESRLKSAMSIFGGKIVGK